MKKLHILIWALAVVAFTSCQRNKGDIYPTDLVCEYLTNPQAVELSHPRLEWVDRPTDKMTRGVQRSAYQIEAASSRQA